MLVQNDTSADGVLGFQPVEAATYCRPNDDKRPGIVGITIHGISPEICPLDLSQQVPTLTDANPDQWFVRIMFDELLDPNIEKLKDVLDPAGNPTGQFFGTLEDSQPAILKCQDINNVLTEVPYDGFYNPAGNAVTWPLGPSLVIKPLDPKIVAVESECEISLKDNIVDKDGIAVPSDQRGPFKFKIAPITFLNDFSGPLEGDEIPASDTGWITRTNVALAPPSATAPQGCVNDGVAAPDPNCWSLTPADKILGPGTGVFSSPPTYPTNTLYFVGGGLLVDDVDFKQAAPVNPLKLVDKCGRESTVKNVPAEINYRTAKMAFSTFNPGGGSAVQPAKKIIGNTNQYLDVSTFLETEDFTWGANKPEGFAIVDLGAVTGGSGFFVAGNYALNTNYVFTIKAGAMITDALGVNTLTFAEEVSTNFTTEPAMRITAQVLFSDHTGAFAPSTRRAVTPNRNVVVLTKRDDATPVRIQLTFNQEVFPVTTGTPPAPSPAEKTFDATDFTLTKADGSAVATPLTIAVSAGAVRVTSPLPPGSYVYTFKSGAALTDRLATPSTYTQSGDIVIRFTVKSDAPMPPPPFKCLGAT